MAQNEGFTNHYGAVRMRITGSGSLIMTLYSLDDVNSVTLSPFTMSATTNKELTRLSNFNEQRAALEIKTTEIDETFLINKIVIFHKPVTSGEFPG